MKQKFKKISGIVSSVLLAFILVLAVLVVDAKMKNKPLFIFGHSALWVLTDSMEPTIPAKSYILIRKADAADVKEDDVITFYSDDPSIAGSLNTHRVKEISADGTTFATKGDNPKSTLDKYPARADAVVAVYVKNLPFLTQVVGFLLTKAGLILILLCSLLMCASFFLPSILKKPEEAPEEAPEAAPAETEAERERRMLLLVKEEVERLERENAQKLAEAPPRVTENGDDGDPTNANNK